jgi:hypothetical protein
MTTITSSLKRMFPIAAIVFALLQTAAVVAADPAGGVEFKIDEAKSEMRIMVDGKEALVYRYGPNVELPYFYPVRSPSGKPMTVEKTNPYPHHRSFWFADTVQPEGERKVSFYESYYSSDRKNPKPPYKDHIRHVEFTPVKKSNDGKSCEIGMKLVWEMDGNKPVIDETRTLRATALGNGEYLLDMHFTATPSSKAVKFISDRVHYAWPFIRINKDFSVEGGGTLLSSTGAKGQKETHDKPALWIDYSNAVSGETEGLAMFAFPQDGKPPLWLTRDYGTFGPRRINAQSGKPFTLKPGESLEQRAGVLVHRGDAKAGKVAERYEAFAKGKQ